MKFKGYPISSEIKDQLQQMGLRRPTDIQHRAIPPILDGEDVLGIAQTGTGKTAAFAIPLLHRILADPKRTKGIKCLVMAPTRELAQQIADEFNEIGKLTRLKILAIYGGVGQDAQISKLQGKIDVLVSTPGRMFDLHHQGYVKFNEVKTLVLDEADRMLDPSFIKDIRDVVKLLPKKRQTLFFSATIDDNIKKLAYSLVHNPIRIQVSPKDPVAKKVDHAVVFVEMDDKRFYLERFINENPESKILVFVRTKVRAERVALAMSRVGITTNTIHGDKDQDERARALKQFKDGTEKVLIATDVSARGIDVKKVEMVINYDLPDDPENYVHRIGRTGRGDHSGLAISFCSTEEKTILDQIQVYLDKEIRVINPDKSEHKTTLDLGGDKEGDWRAVMKKIDDFNQGKKKKKKKK
ncbi:MAG: DEAD/DEAH box helicase [Cyclobacteriaceae bacterium]|nr:DEAD/DEAH box helicase [Cyclobacteriaceae bacterium]